ncbi:CLUMA_CG004250, isoform A [Clunio marinus]|uniref:CLUMA_CG004250, isoform A n=1 Tax=Clunio marinus TaxID=568069 RepID=A0A1J1HSM5_9DIPT|nr:CLUMA_CG004250, isoform A [Clunio marinus]
MRRKPPESSYSLFIGNERIEFVNTLRCLGVYLNHDLSWNSHISNTCGSVNSGLSMLRQSQTYISKNMRLYLVKSLIIPKFTYCSELFFGSSREDWSAINKCFNHCIRYICGKHKYDSISTDKKIILGCSLESYMKYRACLFIFNLLRTKTPQYLYEKLQFPRYPRNCCLTIPTLPKSSQHFQRSFFVLGVRLWNSLSPEIRMNVAQSSFKHECLTFFTSRES